MQSSDAAVDPSPPTARSRTSCETSAIDRRGPYTVVLDEPAIRSLERIPSKIRKTITRQLDTLAYPYDASNVTALQVTTGYRKRIGDYRALFVIDDGEKGVLVTHILTKNEATYR